jgi:hypothetical protein
MIYLKISKYRTIFRIINIALFAKFSILNLYPILIPYCGVGEREGVGLLTMLDLGQLLYMMAATPLETH